jgi:type VI secretion system secreted protein Hcp
LNEVHNTQLKSLIMAQKILLKIDQVVGESQIPRHEKEIEILNWSWSMGPVSSATSAGGGRTAARPAALPFIFSHYVDTASPNLMKLCLQGGHTHEATLFVCSQGRELVEYFKLTFEDVIITSVVISTNDDSSRTIESVNMLFTKAKEEYRQIKPDGTLGQPIIFSFDFLRT